MESLDTAPSQAPDVPMTAADLAALGEGYPQAGRLFSCTLNGVCLAHEDLAARMRAADLDAFLPALPSARVALTRAVRALLARDAERDGFATLGGDLTARRRVKQTLGTPINEGDWLIWPVLLTEADLRGWGFDTRARVRIRLGKQSGQIFCTSRERGAFAPESEDRAFARALQPYWTWFRSHHINLDVSRACYDAVRACASVAIRRDGGLYFVPTGEDARLQRIVAFINGLNGTVTAGPSGAPLPPAMAYALAPGIPARASETTGIATAALVGMGDEITKLANDLVDMARSTPGTLAPGTVRKRTGEYRLVGMRLQRYAALIGLQQDGLQQSLARLMDAAAALEEAAATARRTAPDAAALPFEAIASDAAAIVLQLGGRVREARARRIDLDAPVADAPVLTRAARAGLDAADAAADAPQFAPRPRRLAPAR